jgi:hypothetical protein
MALFVITPTEKSTLDMISEEYPALIADLRYWLAMVLDDLVQTSQGRVVNEAGIEDLLWQLHGQAVGRMLTTMDSWDENEDLRRPVVDLLVRHLLADAQVGSSDGWWERRATERG